MHTYEFEEKLQSPNSYCILKQDLEVMNKLKNGVNLFISNQLT